MAVDRRAVFTDAVVFARIRQLNALGEVKPGLLTYYLFTGVIERD